jgi:hypothetical protein
MLPLLRVHFYFPAFCIGLPADALEQQLKQLALFELKNDTAARRYEQPSLLSLVRERTR